MLGGMKNVFRVRGKMFLFSVWSDFLNICRKYDVSMNNDILV